MQTTRTITRIRTGAVPHTTRTAPRSARTAPSTPLYLHLAGRILRRLRSQLVFYAFAFYLLPVMLPSSADTLLLILAYPVLCFLLSALYGMRYGFISHYLAVPILLFLPASLLAFKAYSFLYALCYLLISCIALTFGALCRQMNR